MIYDHEIEYGYMCFKDIKNLKLIEFLKSRIKCKQIDVMYKCEYDEYKNHYVYIHYKGIHKIIKYNQPLNDIEGIGNLYSFLYDKYGFTNILGFHPIED